MTTKRRIRSTWPRAQVALALALVGGGSALRAEPPPSSQPARPSFRGPGDRPTRLPGEGPERRGPDRRGAAPDEPSRPWRGGEEPPDRRLTEERAREVEAWLQQRLPEQAERLRRLMEHGQKAGLPAERLALVRAMRGRALRQAWRLMEAEREDAELGRLALEDFRLNEQVSQATAALAAAPEPRRAELTAQLRERLRQHALAKLELRQRRLDLLAQRLEGQQARLRQERDSLDALVDQRLQEVLSQPHKPQASGVPEPE